jgi:hypothetical protein
LLHSRIRGPVSSHSHVQGFAVQGFLPSRSGCWLIAGPVPPWRSRTDTHRQAGCHDCSSHLRGFVPRDEACFEVGV